jgi:curved DNA-binding protein CbpA
VRRNFLDCYRILEIEPQSTLEEVKRSYRELVKVWHPDRFAHDPKFAKRAQEKLKLINLAYERLCTELRESAGNEKSQPPHEARDHSSAAKEGPPGETPKESSPETPEAAEGSSPLVAPPAKRKSGLRPIQVGVALGAIAGTVLTFGLYCAAHASQIKIPNATSGGPAAA